MKFNMDEWSQEIIDAKDRRVLPVLYFPCLPLTGYGVIETVNDGKKMAETMKATIDKYPEMICAMTGMDLSVDSEAFGAKVTFKDNEAPSVRGPDRYSGRHRQSAGSGCACRPCGYIPGCDPGSRKNDH